MKTLSRRIILSQAILLVSTAAVWSAEPDAGLPAGQAGAKIYAAKCASCHAKDGKGNPAMAKVFKVEPEKLSLVSEAALAKTDADLIKVTTEGSGKMPAYKGKLSDADISGVIAYTRSLSKPAEPAK